MEFPKMFESFEVFHLLKEKKEYHCPYTNILFKLKDGKNKKIIINEKEYVFKDGINREVLTDEIISPIMEKLEKAERFKLFANNVDSKKLFKHEITQTLLANGMYESPFSSQYLKLKMELEDEYFGFYKIDELIILFENYEGESYQPDDEVFQVNYEVHDLYSMHCLDNWQNDKALRVSVITGAEENPNRYLKEYIEEFIEREEAFQSLSNLPNYCDFLSNLNDERFVFQLEKIINNLENLINDLKSNQNMKKTRIYEWKTIGEKGEYLSLVIEDFTKESLKFISDTLKDI
jgi:hypothetical protein